MTIEKVLLTVKEFQDLEGQIDRFDTAILNSFRDGGDNYFIVEDYYTIKGMISIQDNYERPGEPNIYIDTMYVLKKYRGQEVGKRALDLIKQKFQNEMITCCPFTEESAKFFKREGFVHEGSDPESYYYLYFKA